jgi:hypothetical protein
MKGRSIFTESEIAKLERLIIIRNKASRSEQKGIRQKMRNIGFYSQDDWGIKDLQVSDLRSLIKSSRITVIKPTKVSPVKAEIQIQEPVKPKAISNEIDLSELKIKLENARLKYKPDIVKYLLIAEAPPDSLERFFYYENVHERDYLFLGVVQAVYPELKEKFISSKRSAVVKDEILLKLKADGFYLLDLAELPLSLLKDDLSSQVPNLIEKVRGVINKQTKIILIKANVYDTIFMSLKEEFGNVVDVRIPFPSSGQQTEFQNRFLEALKVVYYLFM